MSPSGYVVLESGQVFPGQWRGGRPSAGEVVFNTAHSGYEEMATDPSYYSQIIVTTAPMQGNYGESNEFWESENIWIRGFVSLQLQQSSRDSSWLKKLTSHQVGIVTDLDTRALVLVLRDQGTTWGAIVPATSPEVARSEAAKLIQTEKTKDSDWVQQVTCRSSYDLKGQTVKGPRVAVLDFGCKKNTLRELQKRCSEIRVFPSRTDHKEILAFQPDGVLLSNGPGNPEDVQKATETVQKLIGKQFILASAWGIRFWRAL